VKPKTGIARAFNKFIMSRAGKQQVADIRKPIAIQMMYDLGELNSVKDQIEESGLKNQYFKEQSLSHHPNQQVRQHNRDLNFKEGERRWSFLQLPAKKCSCLGMYACCGRLFKSCGCCAKPYTMSPDHYVPE
jgi:hypothetical protein